MWKLLFIVYLFPVSSPSSLLEESYTSFIIDHVDISTSNLHHATSSTEDISEDFNDGRHDVLYDEDGNLVDTDVVSYFDDDGGVIDDTDVISYQEYRIRT